jgi:rhodanese-related sulfurtransferase
MIPLPALAALLEARDNSATEIGILFTAAAGLVMLGFYVVPKLRDVPAEHRARKYPANKVMDPIQVEEMVGGMPPVVVDLRSPEEFKGEMGRIRAALNIPFPDLSRRVEELRGSTGNRPIVLVDRTDELSHQAAAYLKQEGFDWVYVLKGGMKAWAASKLPVYR